MVLDFWLVFGLAAQICFFCRFLIQWVASEKKGKSVMPIHFWYLSLVGGIGLFIYSVHRQDIVFMLGQGAGVFIYTRNLVLIKREKTAKKIRGRK